MPALSGKRFSERNQVMVGLCGLVITALVLTLAMSIGKLRLAAFGSEHTAQFVESGGLKKGDDVRVAGLNVGTVKSVEIEGTHVAVGFALEGIDLGDRSMAAIKSDNALGRKYLALNPKGNGDVDSIPLARTSSPYGVSEALQDITATTGELDVDQLAKSFDSMSSILEATPQSFRSAIKGVGALSESLSSRDDALRSLFDNAEGVTGVLARRNVELTQLMSDGSAFFGELEARRAAVHSLLVNTRAAAAEINGLVDDNSQTLRPVLEELQGVISILDRNKSSLEFALTKLAPYIRSLGEAVGGGPFFYAFLQNLVPADLAPIIPDLIREGK